MFKIDNDCVSRSSFQTLVSLHPDIFNKIFKKIQCISDAEEARIKFRFENGATD